MLRNTLGIINIEGKNVQFGQVMAHRGTQAFSFLGRYRLIDFVLSNMSNSGITDFQIYLPDKGRSTIQHIGTGKNHNINSKRGRLRFLANESEISAIYKHDIRLFTENLRFIEGSRKEYVLIAPSYFIYSQDYAKLKEQHLETNADITVLYKNVSDAQNHYIGCSTVKLDDDRRVVAFQDNHGKYKNRAVSLEAYFMKRSVFLDLIKRANRVSALYWLKDILKDVVQEYRIYGYAHRDFVACIDSVPAYFTTQLDLINATTRRLLFKPDWPIHTKSSDSAPTLYGPLAQVKGSLISNGNHINGVVENSVIDHDVCIEEGAVIKNAIIMKGATIKRHAHIENAIIDKEATIKNPLTVQGTREQPAYINLRDII